MLRAWQGVPGTGPAWAWGDRGTPHLVPLAQPHSPLHGDTGSAGALVPGLSPRGVGTAAWGCAVPRGRVRPPRARLCHALPCKSQALPRRAGLCRALPRRAGRAGGWSMARCHSGKYFAGATAAGPRPPAAVGAPGDPGAGASSRLPLPHSSSEAASSAPTPPTPPRPLARTPHEGMGTTALAAGDLACPLAWGPPGCAPPAGPGEVPSMPRSLLAGPRQSPAHAAPSCGARAGGWGKGRGKPLLSLGETLGLVEFSTGKTAESQGRARAAGHSPGHGTVPCLWHIPASRGLRLVAAGKPWHTGDGMCPHRCPPAISPGGSRPCLSGGTEQPGGFSCYPPEGESGRAPASLRLCGETEAQGMGTHVEAPVPIPVPSCPDWPPLSGDTPLAGKGLRAPHGLAEPPQGLPKGSLPRPQPPCPGE